jgi:hypothetical protein
VLLFLLVEEQSASRRIDPLIRPNTPPHVPPWWPDNATENIATRLSALADQLRESAASASGQVVRYGGEAARRGEDGLKWLSDETANRPLPTLAIAVGFGVLIGMMLRSGNAKENK